jgi:hypothetical protein
VNKLVSLPVIAAVPTTAPSVLEPAPSVLAPATADDSKLRALADEYILATRKYGDALVARDELLEKGVPPLPEILRIRPRDLELGKKPNFDDDEFWHRPCDMGLMERSGNVQVRIQETDERMEIVTLKVQPSEELSARGAEITAAYDTWRASAKKPRGYKKAERAANKAMRDYYRLEEAVSETRAATVEGMLAKIRCAEADECGGEITGFNSGCPEVMALSIFQDIKSLAGKTAS